MLLMDFEERIELICEQPLITGRVSGHIGVADSPAARDEDHGGHN